MRSSLAVAVLLVAVVFLATTTTVVVGDVALNCTRSGEWSGVEPATATGLKEALVDDLIAQTPEDPNNMYYCNFDTWRGLTMWGYAECADVSRCPTSLSHVGSGLKELPCAKGEGTARDSDDVCYAKVGFSQFSVCPRVRIAD
ncbi:unnamed protein product [Linum trigynum]